MTRLSLAVFTVSVWLVAGCDGIGVPSSDGTDDQLREVLVKQNLEPMKASPQDPAAVALGQALFFDKILSGNRNISCSTCHLPEEGTGDGLSLSFGQNGQGRGPDREAPIADSGDLIIIPRNAPPVFNRAQLKTMFWDARVADLGDGEFVTPAGDDLLTGLNSALAAQAMFPVTSRDEMRGMIGENELGDVDDADLREIWTKLMDRLLMIDEYVTMFGEAFPEVPNDELTFAHAANAIAAFEIDHWTLDDSPFDEYLRGDDSALTDSAKRGALLFYGEARCSVCHAGSSMTDERFHNMAIPAVGPGKGDGEDGTADFGRERVTGNASDRYAFRTPSLRNVSDTGPWMHNGAFVTLSGAVRHMLDPVGSSMGYDASQLSDDIRPQYRPEQTAKIVMTVSPIATAPIDLPDLQVADLVAFLESLSSPRIAELPELDRPNTVPSGLSLDD